jgi:hypothetical protein
MIRLVSHPTLLVHPCRMNNEKVVWIVILVGHLRNFPGRTTVLFLTGLIWFRCLRQDQGCIGHCTMNYGVRSTLYINIWLFDKRNVKPNLLSYRLANRRGPLLFGETWVLVSRSLRFYVLGNNTCSVQSCHKSSFCKLCVHVEWGDKRFLRLAPAYFPYGYHPARAICRFTGKESAGQNNLPKVA